MKKYVIIAGVNGAGKSTLYQTNDSLKTLPRVNVDEIVLHYVSVESVEIAKERVKHRVQQGGHDIPERDIEKRYAETFK